MEEQKGAWGWHAATNTWVKLAVTAAGLVRVST